MLCLRCAHYLQIGVVPISDRMVPSPIGLYNIILPVTLSNIYFFIATEIIVPNNIIIYTRDKFFIVNY